MILVEDLDAGAVGNVARGDDARPLGRDRQPPRAFDLHPQGHALEIEHDIGDILAHARHGGKLVQHVVDLDAGDRGPLQR